MSIRQSGELGPLVINHRECHLVTQVGTVNSTITIISNEGTVELKLGRSVFTRGILGNEWTQPFESEVDFMTFSAMNSILFVYCKDGSLHFLSVYGKTRQAILKDQEGINLIALSSDEKTLATAKGKLIELWKFPSGESMEKPILGTANFTTITFSPDCKSIVSGSVDGTLQIWTLL